MDRLKNNKMYLLIGLAACAVLVIYFFRPGPVEDDWDEFEPAVEEETAFIEEQAEEETIVVDVKGAVANPGVYEAKTGDRVIDLIHLAGGLLENADQNQINFAMKVSDEMVLYFPTVGEGEEEKNAGISTVIGAIASSPDDGKINLNTASQAELETLTGIGPSKAAAIIEYRETNGPFKEVSQLKEVSGIGEKTFAKLEDEITVK